MLDNKTNQNNINKVKYIGLKGLGPERPIIGQFHDYSGYYIIPFGIIGNSDKIFNCVDELMRNNEILITGVGTGDGEVDVNKADFSDAFYIFQDIAKLDKYMKPATKIDFENKGLSRFYIKFIKNNILSSGTYYSNSKLMDYIDKVVLWSYNDGDSICVGKNQDGDFVFYIVKEEAFY